MGIHQEFAQTTDQSCLNRFLTEVGWEGEKVNDRRLDLLQTEPSTRYSAQGVIPIGNTLIDRTGYLIPDVVRVLMSEAAKKTNVSLRRLSFTGTLKVLRCRLPECPKSRQGLKRWYEDLLAEIAEEVLPERRNRINPRVIKRKMNNWRKKRPEYRLCPQPTKKFRQSVEMLI